MVDGNAVKRIVALSLTAGLLAAISGPPASASPEDASAGRLPAPLAARLDAARGAMAAPLATAARLRSAAANHHLADILGTLRAQSLLTGHGGQPPRHSALPARVTSALASLPSAAAAAATRLLIAVLDARTRVASARLPLSSRAALRRASTLQLAVARAGPEASAAARRMRTWEREVGADDGVGTVIDAGLDVARALDRALPSLLALHGTAADGAAGGDCDQADVPSVLCVGGTGANTHSGSYALTIDLGGDDNYTGHDGAGGCSSCQPVSVLIDLGGNDRYTAGPDGYVAGAANSGVGLAVDAAGDDTYQGATGEGAGLLGVGALEDLGGTDTYIASAHSATTAAQAYGQGSAILGLGALVDEGLSNDTYTIDVSGTSGIGGTAVTAASGQAYALGGSLLADDGGTDHITAHIASGEGVAIISGQASGQGGPAYLLEGLGDTTYEQSITGTETFEYVFGQGEASVDGTAVLDDAGGNDVYRIDGQTDRTVTAVADDACGCTEASAEASSVNPDTFLIVQGGAIWGQGFAISFGTGLVGLVWDHAGNDTYSARLTGRSTAVAENDLAGPSDGATADTLGPFLTITAQGMTGQDPGAFGMLEDSTGNDTYDALAESDAFATARSADPSSTETATASGGSILVDAQGIGMHGLLFDGSGDDHYSAVSRSEASADPTPALARDGLATLQAHGSYDGGALIDLGGSDRFAEEPNVGAQTGRYGEGGSEGGYWVNPYSDIYQYVDANQPGDALGPAGYLVISGEGFAPGGSTKQETSVSFGSPGPVTLLPGANTVTATLRSAGVPIGGAPVLFEVERSVPCPPDGALICAQLLRDTAHEPVFRTHGVTAADGTTQALFDASDLGAGDYVLVAVYSGDDARRFSVAVLPMKVT